MIFLAYQFPSFFRLFVGLVRTLIRFHTIFLGMRARMMHSNILYQDDAYHSLATLMSLTYTRQGKVLAWVTRRAA